MLPSSGSTWMTVSAEGMAVSTASWFCSAATFAAMIVWETSGRTASCSSTLHSSSPSAASAAAVVSLRVPAPSRIWLTLVYSPLRTIARTSSR